MKYSDWNMNGNSIFYELNELNPDRVISILGVEQLDLYYHIHYGAKPMLPSLENVTSNAIAHMLNNMYMKKWEQLANIYLNDFEVGFDSSTTTETNVVTASNKDIATANTQQVSAYNDENMSDVSGEVDSINEQGDSEQTTTVTIINKSIQSIDFQRALLENSNISDVICKDVSQLISLSIY